MQTTDRIRQFISAELLSNASPSSLGDTDALIESGIIDSYGIMSVIAFIEKDFGIQLESHELIPDNFENIRAIAGLVDRKLGK